MLSAEEIAEIVFQALGLLEVEESKIAFMDGDRIVSDPKVVVTGPSEQLLRSPAYASSMDFLNALMRQRLKLLGGGQGSAPG